MSRSMVWGSWKSLLITLPWMFGVYSTQTDGHRFAEIAHREQIAQCIVTAHEPSNHNRYRYQFSVGGRKYYGLSNAVNDAATVGAVYEVFYDPRDPNQNSLQDFAETSARTLRFSRVLITGILLIAAVILAIRLYRRGATTFVSPPPRPS